ncbi:MAG: hypothetical protein AMXMBFR4_10670 [Candidatus Hydrogenedentota bacterium]
MLKKAKYRALVIDDSREIRALIVKALTQEGIECTEAADGVMAANALRSRSFDLVTVDLVMPRAHGYSVITDLLEKPDPPVVIVVTGVTDGRMTRDLLRRGVTDVMYKPLVVDLFAAKAITLLERRESTPPSQDAKHAGRLPQQLEEVTASLQSQLELVQKSFQATIENLERQKEDLESGLLGSVRVLTNIIEQVGRFHGSHAVRVEKLANAIGQKTALSKQQLKDLKVAALLHDIGQFGMPDTVRLRLPWELGPEERKIFESYPVIGSLLLAEIPGLENVARMVEHHTENYDGTGFPAGLRGEKIPLGARILAVADGYDTFASFAKDEDPVEYLSQQKGRRFDAELVEHAVSYIRTSAKESDERPVERIPIMELRPGQTLADPIYDERGLLLVRSETVLSARIIEQIRKLVPHQVASIVAVRESLVD